MFIIELPEQYVYASLGLVTILLTWYVAYRLLLRYITHKIAQHTLASQPTKNTKQRNPRISLRYNDKELIDIMVDYKKGLNVNTIAKKYNRSVNSIYNIPTNYKDFYRHLDVKESYENLVKLFEKYPRKTKADATKKIKRMFTTPTSKVSVTDRIAMLWSLKQGEPIESLSKRYLVTKKHIAKLRQNHADIYMKINPATSQEDTIKQFTQRQ